MSKHLNPHLRAIAWQRTGEAEFPYAASVDGQDWRVRVGDFPAEALYTLLVAGESVAEYDDWPAAWQRPE